MNVVSEQLFCLALVIEQSASNFTYFGSIKVQDVLASEANATDVTINDVPLSRFPSLRKACMHRLESISIRGDITPTTFLSDASCAASAKYLAGYICFGDCTSGFVPLCDGDDPPASSNDSSTVWIVVLASVLGVAALGLAGYCVYQRCEVRLE